MSKQQTAIMTAIERCNKKQGEVDLSYSIGLELAMSILRELLPVEKQQIEQTFIDCCFEYENPYHCDAQTIKIQAEQYYNDTFKTN